METITQSIANCVADIKKQLLLQMPQHISDVRKKTRKQEKNATTTSMPIKARATQNKSVASQVMPICHQTSKYRRATIVTLLRRQHLLLLLLYIYLLLLLLLLRGIKNSKHKYQLFVSEEWLSVKVMWYRIKNQHVTGIATL